MSLNFIKIILHYYHYFITDYPQTDGIHQSFIIMLLDSLGQEFDQYIVGVSCLHVVL